MPPWSAAWTSRDPSGTAERARLPSPRSTAPKDNAGPGLGGVIAALLLSVGGRAANVTVARPPPSSSAPAIRPSCATASSRDLTTGAAVHFVAVAVYTLGELSHSPTSTALALEIATDAERGQGMAVFQTSWSLAAALAPLLFTALIARPDP
jgi:hypothetical protein